MGVSRTSRCQLMLLAAFWMLLFTHFRCVNSLHGIYENNVTCNLTAVQDYCPHSDREFNAEDAYVEATEISQCMKARTHKWIDQSEINVSGSVKCLLRYLDKKIGHHRENFTGIRQMFLNAESEMILGHGQQKAQTYECLLCIISELNFALNSTDSLNTSDTKSNYFGLKNYEIIRRIFTVILFMNVSKNVTNVGDKHFFDTNTWENFFITLTNNTLDRAEIRKEVDKVIREKEEKCVPYDKAKNCGFCSRCTLRPILWFLYVIAIFENGILVLIFIRHHDMRTERNTIILNLAVADILAVIFNASLQIIFIYGGTYKKSEIYYKVTDMCLEVTTGVCIYTIVALSVQRYYAVVPSYKCNECSHSRRFNSTLFLCVLWIVGCVPKVIEFSIQMGLRAWAMRNLIIYCVIPVVTMATFYFMTSWRLKKSVRMIPGEAVGQETTRSARVRSSNVLIALVAVFVISYAPIQLFRFIELWFYGGGYLFDYADLIAYSLLSLNSCFNPVALYVASGTFRRYYNRYICYRWNNNEGQVSNPTTNN